LRNKRPKRDFYEWLNCSYRFKESVIHVQKYLNILDDELKQLSRKLITFKGDTLQLFNETFYTYKIKFVMYNDYDGKNGIVKGVTNKENIEVRVNEDFYLYTNKDNLDIFKEFKFDLLLLFSHELVHRGQYYVRAGDKINFYNFDGEPTKTTLEYLDNPHEAMAYALMYIESLRYSGVKNDEILAMLKTGNFLRSDSIHITFYIKDMKASNYNMFKRFRKYLYQYLVDPITYDLRLV